MIESSTKLHEPVSRWKALLFGDPGAISFFFLAALPASFAAWLLLSARVVMTRQSAMDLLFNLAGGWQITQGRIPHIDFHEPVGPLNFVLTAIGFQVVGFSPFAFLVGETIVFCGLFLAGLLVAWRRLPMLAAAVFVLYCSLPAVLPHNLGDPLGSYTFAMSYNRYGWSAIGIVSLILFVPPRFGRAGVVIDAAIAAILMAAMFYLKITYFLVGLAGLVLALLVSEHIRARRPVWIGIALLAAVHTAAPYSWPYLADIWREIVSGTPAMTLVRFLRVVIDNYLECSLYGIGLIAAIWCWRFAASPSRIPISAAFLLFSSVFLIAQNSQIYGLRLGGIIAFVLYEPLARRNRGKVESVLPVVALLVVPALSAAANVAALGSYHLAAGRTRSLLVVDRTNIRGLAIPDGGANPVPDVLLRANPSQRYYVATLLEAADFFADGQHAPGRIQILDRVNPFPFMLGFPPPRGGDLFWNAYAPLRPAAEILADADYLLVPKASTSQALTKAAIARYGGYIAEHFPNREESSNWELFSRK